MKYDVIIIGAGPAGMTAALYAARANLNTLLLERGIPGGQMNNTAEVENYPGFDSILGPDLALKMYDGINQFGVEHGYGNVVEVKDHQDYKEVITDDASYEAKVVIIATGCEHRNLEVPGEAEYSGRGVSYCAVCDGAFFRNKKLIVVGGGDSAVEEAIYLTQFADEVKIVHRRDALRAQKIIQDRAFANEKISFIWDSVVEEIKGDDQKVTGVQIKNVKTGETYEEAADGVFIYVGLIPLTQAFTSLGITDDAGWIVTDERMQTKIPGLLACGDARQKHLRQITTAVGDGGIAGQQAYQYIEENK
ncbi:thioredoxin-disulfide reductase [Enterococcus cecorum]|uniref:thioredoxin-disulfide reductase n=1 Tax=Enterococcus cecorum TaxID=44008 RepID=UPI00148C5001|nr:thioredoxin-disulfide reductase [Enterococcus cecorum]MCJ0521380.1 thioredoxin-disulfide reductase [Enterococcus cecorum]MCJ0542851.1 thioredoxin-disulfide reductase [Enterococcus cecorum]MCJ0548737.1 thioredoxin-disulfide reductase [Enterococcus cecorum]MCJ0559354.1 thioredoxin-disulfide reductase [Enterococcus cecorum]MCJ0598314.1 thioredoxin-disulfide reductase [Enterococcus cecorum]